MTPATVDFFDTNVLVYAFSDDPRAEPARALMERGGCIGVQSLNEFANVMRRKFAVPWTDLRVALADLRRVCGRILPMDMSIHTEALRIAEHHRYSIFDSLLIATALAADSERFWSEDMGDGVLIDGRLRILDPLS